MLGNQLLTVTVTTASIVALQLVCSVTSLSHSFVNMGFISPALANTPQYVPPSRGTLQRTEAGGSRGCIKSIPLSITLLVPNNHIGQTVSERPTFSWYVSNPSAVSVPIQFALVEPGVARPLFVTSLKADKTGLMQLELPSDAPELQPKHKYRWTVSLICNTKRPSENVYVTGWVERVTATTNQAKAIMAAGSNNERAVVYAQSGMWYDALTNMYKAFQANPQDSSTSESFVSLLDEAGLTQVARQAQQRFNVK